MHLFYCVLLIIIPVVYTMCFAKPCDVPSSNSEGLSEMETCNICVFEKLADTTTIRLPGGSSEVKFVNCHFGTYKKDIVYPEDKVRMLWVENSVESIEDAAIWNYQEAHFISFARNNISVLPDFVFEALSNLEKVDFSWNRIVKIGENVFTRASSITDLNLADNRIESFCIKQLVNLQSVNLENNLITVLSEIPKTLRMANFNFNRLTKITNFTFDNMKFLQKLYLGSNNITEIESGAFYGTTHLEYVDLSCNNLTIVKNVMQGSKLVNWGSIDDQEEEFSLKLNLQQNKITSFSSTILNIFDESDLVWLDLSQNSIEKLDKTTFNVTTKIMSLDLSNNKIKTVPIAFFHSQYHQNPISVLTLSTNAITQLEVGSFIGLASLISLDLSHNCIETLNETIFLDTPNLQKLYLAYNRIINLNGPEIVEFTHLHLITLEGNKFSNFAYVIEQFIDNDVEVARDRHQYHRSGNGIDCDLEFSKEIAVKDGISTSGIVIISILCVAATIFILMYAIYYKMVKQPSGIPEDLQEFANIN